MKTMGKRSVSSFLAVLVEVSWFAVAIGAVLMVCLSFVPLFADVRQFDMDLPVSFSVDAQAVHASAAIGGESVQVRKAHGRGSLTFPPPGGAFFSATTLSLAVLLALLLWALGQVRAVFRTLRAGQPFAPANAGRIRWIGYAVIAGELARTAVVFVANSYAMRHFTVAGLHFNAWPDVNLLAIVHGLIILVIAEVFRMGARLDEDQSLTV